VVAQQERAACCVLIQLGRQHTAVRGGVLRSGEDGEDGMVVGAREIPVLEASFAGGQRAEPCITTNTHLKMSRVSTAPPGAPYTAA
jgi:hypothetical protein